MENTRSNSEEPTENWLRRNRVAAAVFVIALLVTGLITFALLKPPLPQPAGTAAGPGIVNVETARVTSRTAVIALTENATVIANPEVLTVSRQTGWVQQVLARKGQRVSEGQTLAVVRVADGSIEEAEARYESSRQALATARADLRGVQGTTAGRQAALKTAQTRLAQARTDLFNSRDALKRAQIDVSDAAQALQSQRAIVQRNESLYRQGAVSMQEVQQAQLAQDEATALLDQSKASLSTAQAQTQSASTRVKTETQALNNERVQLSAATTAANAARANVARQQAAFASAQNQLRIARQGYKSVNVTSPVNGTITSVDVKRGAFTTPTTEIVRISPVGASMVQFDVSDDGADKLKVGMPATVTMPQKRVEYKGLITEIPPTTDGGTRRNRVLLTVRDPQSTLKPGVAVKAQVPLGRVKGLSVPTAAIRSSTDGPVVWTVENGKTLRRPVTVAGAAGNNSIITSGLTSGDVVIVYSDGPLANGTRVQAVALSP
ncbi:MAG: efflux RND transporter periplasmic adaptor subunit [Armatimonadota bacterium]|nr:efflux RND transporter periplasmic adaptor subunit [bacterium]